MDSVYVRFVTVNLTVSFAWEQSAKTEQSLRFVFDSKRSFATISQDSTTSCSIMRP